MVHFQVRSCRVPCSGYPSFVLQSLESSPVVPEIWSALYLLFEPLICTALLRMVRFRLVRISLGLVPWRITACQYRKQNITLNLLMR